MNRGTSISKNVLRLRLRFNWLLEDIYDNVCRNYGLTNAGWYPSSKLETWNEDSPDVTYTDFETFYKAIRQGDV